MILAALIENAHFRNLKNFQHHEFKNFKNEF